MAAERNSQSSLEDEKDIEKGGHGMSMSCECAGALSGTD